MHDGCSPETKVVESILLHRNETDDAISLSLCMTPDKTSGFDDALALLSSWWLRWIALVDCDFHYDGQTWHANCCLPQHAHRLLPQVLRDLSAIKNVVCT